MSEANETHLIVLEIATGLVAHRTESKRWNKLSLTFRETRLNLGGVPLWVKYPSHAIPAHVTAACQRWLDSQKAMVRDELS